ncbi:MAG: c-type cytochrome [Rhodospirillales bacterium]
MSRSLEALVLAGGLLLMAGAAAAQTYGFGRPATPADIAGWDIDARGDGGYLPDGRGSVRDGETLYQERCVSCHGDFGEGRDRWPAVAGGAGTLREDDPQKTPGSYWPAAPILYDYIRRAMPFGAGMSMTADETYAVTAYVLYLNDLVPDDAVLDKASLAAVKMPNAGGFVRADDQKPDVVGSACMTDCRTEPPRITSDLARRLDVTPGLAAPRAEAAPAPAAATPAPAPAAQPPAVAAATPAGDAAKGKAAFAKCRACHTVEKGGRNLVGPNLHGVLDRKAGTLAGFAFSDAMKQSGLAWSEDTLRRYLRAPAKTVPKTKMIFAGITKDSELDDLMAYLREATR